MKPRQPKFSKIYAAHEDAEARAECARVVWVETLSELEAAGLVTEPRLNILKRYAELRTEYEFYYSQATFKGPVTEGPNGGQVFSMKWAALFKMNDQLMKLEESLLISPKAAGDKVPSKFSDAPAAPADKYLERSNAH